MRKAIVTAADTSHAVSLARLTHQCAEYMADFDLYVYDLGMTDADRRQLNQEAELLKYDYAVVPQWHNIKVNAGEYGWKPVCVHEISQDNDLVFWIDAGCDLQERLSDEILHATKHGIYASLTRGTLAEYTDPRTLKLMGIPAGYYDTPMRSASLIGFDMKKPAVQGVVKAWAGYAVDKTVFAPEGSSKYPKVKGDTNPQFNHRQDQSVFTALLTLFGVGMIPGARWNWKNQQDIDKRPRNFER